MTPEMLLFLKIAIWIACAIIGAKLMKQKNRSEVIGAILGVLLGIIGLIIILFIPEKKIEEDPNTVIVDAESTVVKEE